MRIKFALVIPFRVASSLDDTPNFLAIPQSESPAATRYVFGSGSATGAAGSVTATELALVGILMS